MNVGVNERMRPKKTPKLAKRIPENLLQRLASLFAKIRRATKLKV